MHARRPDGRHLLDAQAYRDALAAVRKAVGDELLVQVTSEAAGVYRAAEQMAMVRELAPEAVSVGLREIAVPEIPESELAAFLAWLAERRVLTQIILYDEADVRRWQALRQRGLAPAGAWSVLFVLGRYSAGQTSSAHDLLPFLAASDHALPWAVCAFGPEENACVTTAAAFGGHMRVGFENNLKLRDGAIAPDNAALVRQAAEGARAPWAVRWPTRPTRAGSTAPSPDQAPARRGRIAVSPCRNIDGLKSFCPKLRHPHVQRPLAPPAFHRYPGS